MPKITAPTVAEHRLAQRRSLLTAAAAIIGEGGVAAVSPRSVGERAGLARSTFYEYFPSKDDLLAALAIEAFDNWAAELDATVSAAPAGRPRLHAYVEATMRLTADGKHSLATGLERADLSPTSLEAIRAMHDSLAAPLRTLLEELGMPDPTTHASLIQGLLNAGVQLVEHGADAQKVIAAIIGLLDDGFGLPTGSR